MDFYAVYIMEAHPTDIWQMSSNIRDKVLFHSPRSEAERTSIADSCVRTLGIRFPAVIDGMDNRVEKGYTGWPDRLYFITTDGRIQFKTDPGPFGFHPQGLAAKLKTELGS